MTARYGFIARLLLDGHAARLEARAALAIVLLLIGWPERANARSSRAASVTVRATQSRIVTAPRQIVSLAVWLHNEGQDPLRLEAELVLPSEWQAIGVEPEIDLAGKETSMRLVHFRVPQSAEARRYRIFYLVVDRFDPGVRAHANVEVEVEAVTGLDVELLEAPKVVVAGDSYSVHFLVRNRSNTELTFDLGVDAGVGRVTPELDAVRLGPGESRRVALDIATQEGRRGGAEDSRVTLRATALGGAVEAAAVSLVRVLAPVSGLSASYRTLPTEVAIGIVTSDREGGSSGLHVRARGAGVLDASGRRHVHFDVEGPDTLSDSSLGRRNAFLLGYQDDRYTATLGDRAFVLSHLTERGHYGRGVSVDRVAPLWTVGGYLMSDRFTALEEMALRVEGRPLRGFSLGLNLLQKSDRESSRFSRLGEGDQQIGSLTGRFRLAHLVADVEAARSRGGGGESDEAYRMAIDGDGAGARYGVEWLRAGARFGGYPRNQEMLWAHVNAKVSRRFLVRAALLDDRNAEARRDLLENPLTELPEDRVDPLPPVHLRSQDMRLGAQLLVGPRWNGALDLHRRERIEPNGAGSPIETLRETIGITSSHSFGAVSLLAAAERGTFFVRSSGQRESAYAARLAASIRGGRHVTYSAALSQERNRFALGNELRRADLGLSLRFPHRFDLDVQAQWSEEGDEDDGFLGGRDRFERFYYLLRTSYLTPWEHRIELRARWRTDRDDPALRLVYSMPVSLPIAQRRDVGTVRGRLFDEETGEGIGGALIRNGVHATLSKADGTFVFAGLAPGEHHLQVDLRRDDVAFITAIPSPLLVAVEGGKRRDIAIPVTKGATLDGSLLRLRREDANTGLEVSSVASPLRAGVDEALVVAGPVVGVAVRLVGENQTVQRLTDETGRFSFVGLRPGRWLVQIDTEGLPEGHRLDKSGIEVLLGAGTQLSVDLRALPVVRRLQMLELAPIEVAMGR